VVSDAAGREQVLGGDLDLLLHFRVQETGIQCGDTEASLAAKTFGGTSIQGTDSIVVTDCE